MDFEQLHIKATDGSDVIYYDKIIASTSVYDVYKTIHSDSILKLFRDKECFEHISNVITKINSLPLEDYSLIKKSCSLPIKTINDGNVLGFVVPFIPKDYFFESGVFSGKERSIKWYLNSIVYNKFLETENKGSFLDMLQVCKNIARLNKAFHAANLFQYDHAANYLFNINSHDVYIVSLDNFHVEGETYSFMPSPDFASPEYYMSGRKYYYNPTLYSDYHALAVIIYMMLLKRHPLRGGKVNNLDPAKDEELTMGEKALFIEHPTDKSNRVKPDQLSKRELPEGDPAKMPYTICGPYLKKLFDKAFIDGLHKPSARPTAQQWEDALVKTADLVLPCQNPNCNAHWYVFDNTKSPKCPFCGTAYKGQLPVLNLYYAPRAGQYIDEKFRLMVYDKQTLYKWHSNNLVSANERTSAEDKKPVGDFHFFNGQWILINRRLPDMYDVTGKKAIPVGQYVPLTDGRQILLDKSRGGRLIVVQLVSN